MSRGIRFGRQHVERRTSAAAAAALLLAFSTGLEGAGRYDPALRFRSITTPNFVIHFHEGEEVPAGRLAAIAEEVHRELITRMERPAPRQRTHVVLVDQSDRAGGWAATVPYNLIEITATGPSAASLIGHTTDWLRLVFTHEYAHVLHLDRSRGWARVARALFGRVPFAMPNLALPAWQIEGLATYEESRGGEGRLHAVDFDAIVREAARTGEFEPLDRVTGPLIDWPGGQAPYAYGARFHAYLAGRYGSERLAQLAQRTAGSVPFFGAGSFRTIFAKPLSELWTEFAEAERARAAAAPARDSGRAARLTHTGDLVEGPRFDGEGGIVYSRSDAHGWPFIERVPIEGGATERLATRIGGAQLGVTREAFFFDQVEYERSVGLKSDLYRLDRRTGEVRRLTRGARLADPDVSPDGHRFAAIRLSPTRRDVVVWGRTGDGSGTHRGRIGDRPRPNPAASFAAPPEPLTADIPDAWFARPRWSPDGHLLAAESRIAGISNIVVFDVEKRARTLIAPAPGRSITPAWAPDGRSLLFASDRDGGTFAIYRAWLADEGMDAVRVERLTDLPGGAHSPDVSADGKTMTFVGYTADGYDVFTQSLDPARRLGPAAPDGAPARDFSATSAPGALRDAPRNALSRSRGDVPSNAASSAPNHAADFTGSGASNGAAPPEHPDASPYRPWPTLVPRFWLPVAVVGDHEWELGASTGGTDALAYHTWRVAATWPLARDERFDALPGRARPDVVATYVYDRWRPTVYAQFEDDTAPILAGRGTASEQAFTVHDRSVTVGTVLPFRRVRRTQTLTAAWRLERRVVDSATARVKQTRGSARFGWAVSTATRFGYSISPERGVAAGVGLEVSRPALGSDFSATYARADLRAYLPAAPRHGVFALRAATAMSTGDPEGRRTLRLGGAGGDPGPLNLAEDASSLLRGFPSDAFLGDRVALVNAEYRVPIAWPQRGVRHWPVFLRALHGALFADAGHAWTGRAFRIADVKWSWGAELSSDVTIGYWRPLTATMGIAWGRDGAHQRPDNRQVYARLGYAF
ncbi:MAG TPA: hypothetical protein VNK41_00120 [Vicinamibacterales bacterium]|nr:hypothetical protein [Vicinamibacterales bacterium]